MSITPISGALGAEISGVDLNTVSDTTFDEIYQAFLDHQVIFFRDQELAPEAYIALARRFGDIADYPFAKGMDSHPEITEIIKEPKQTSNFGGMWHTDTTYLPQPPKCTLLYAIETPVAGGDTLFANSYDAFTSLSPGMQQILEGLKGVNSSDLNVSKLRADHLATGTMKAATSARTSHEAAHPAVRTHPETGRKSLYINPSHTSRFETMTAEESASILSFLFQHMITPERTARFRWTPGSLAIWDNRCSQHCAINDYDGHRRVMQRITISGDTPV